MVVEALGERAASIPLAIAPTGTINLLARELGYASEPRRFAAQLAEAWRAGEKAILLDRFDFPQDARFRLVGVGVSNFLEEENEVAQGEAKLFA